MRFKRESEWQLVLFTIFTQMSVGTFVIWGSSALCSATPDNPLASFFPAILLTLTLVMLFIGILCAGMHLGNPFHAIFSVNNPQSSWLSREAILGGTFALLIILVLLRYLFDRSDALFDRTLIGGAIITGLLLVYSISRLYMIRTVPAWNNLSTPVTFFITTFLLGAIVSSMLAVLLDLQQSPSATGNSIFTPHMQGGAVVILFSFLQLAVFTIKILYLNHKGGVAEASVCVLWTGMRQVVLWRCFTAWVGIATLTLLLLGWPVHPFFWIGMIFIVASEALDRILFYGIYRREGY